MKRESDFWNRIRKAFPFAERIENKLRPGVSDVFYSLHTPTSQRHRYLYMGWFELKYMLRVPKNGIVDIPHYTHEQKLWFADLWRRRVPAHLLLGIGDRCLIFRADSDIVTTGPYPWTIEQLESEAIAEVPIRDGEEIVSALTVDLEHISNVWGY